MAHRTRLALTVTLILVLTVLIQPMAARPLLAQGPEPLIAGVDRMDLSTDDSLELTVVVSAQGTNVAQPRLPDLDGFSIVGNSTQTQISIVNGVMSNDIIYKYRLQPYRAGELVIGPVTLEMNGQTYTTNPITIQVSQGTGQTTVPGGEDFQAPSQLENKDLFVEALVDNPNPYVGQQIKFIFRYYEAADALRPFAGLGGQPDYRPPALTGFWSEGDTDVTSYRLAVDGRIYTVTELSNLLFPTTAGDVSIEPATITIPGFGVQGETKLQTDPVAVDVKPLPAGAPATFNGAVGQFTIDAQVDLPQTRVDEPVNLRVTVAGQGNIGTLGDPVLPELPGWRTFESDASTDARVENDVIVGERVVEELMLPTTAGDFTLPAIEYSYFDPATESYQTVSTQPIALAVAPGVDGAVAPSPLVQAPTTARSKVAAVPAAAAPAEQAPAMGALKTVPDELARVEPPVTSAWWYWALWTMPLAVMAGGFVWQRRRHYLHANAAAVRSSRAHKQARRALADVGRGSGTSDAAFAGVYAAMTEYLSAKLRRPVSGMTRPVLTGALTTAGVDRTDAQRTAALLDAAEHGRYSPAGMEFASPQALVDEAMAVVDLLEKEFGR